MAFVLTRTQARMRRTGRANGILGGKRLMHFETGAAKKIARLRKRKAWFTFFVFLFLAF